MKREKMYKKRYIRSMKWSFVLLGFSFLFLIPVIWFALSEHLYVIQNYERLERFQDYDEFKLDFGDTSLCENTHYLLYEDNDYRYYTNCNHDINIYFGSTPTTLKNALQEGYVNFDTLKKDAKRKVYTNYTVYSIISIDKSVSANYVMKLYNEENDKSRVYIEPL